MPHSIRSPSSPSLRDPYKPALDDLLLSRPYAMSPPRPSLSRSPSLRPFSSRRPRPCVASIADVFVGSLVLAGLCHEHSPRGRGLSTLSLDTSKVNPRRFRTKGRANHDEPPCQRRWQFSAFPLRPSQPQSRLSHGLAQMEEVCSEEPVSNFKKTDRQKENNYHVLPGLPELPEDNTQQPIEDYFFDTIPGNLRLTISAKKELSDGQISKDTIQTLPAQGPSPSRDERVQRAMSDLLMRHLGPDYNWQGVYDVLFPKKEFVRKVDDTRDATEIASVAALVGALPSRQQSSAQYLFSLYRQLPSPGVAYLSQSSRTRLLRQVGMSPNRRWSDARRYLALVNDMITAGLPMTLWMWTSAIHMAGRGNNGTVSKRRLIQAIGLWQHMEHVAGIRADNVVFTILFTTAVKSGQFVVAGRLEEEMHNRGLRFPREGLVFKIYYSGIQKDVRGIHAAFDAFIDSGELVDTVALNALMASFLRAGEVETAEQLYTRMNRARVKTFGFESGVLAKQPSLSTDFTYYRSQTKKLGALLKRSTRLKDASPEDHSALQESLPMTPDSQTFHIWLRHCTRVSGNLEMFMNILRDMENTYDIPPRHSVYLFLFHGFSIHGRHKKTQWTVEKLRRTWLGFIDAVRDTNARLSLIYPNKSSVIWENPLGELDVQAENSVRKTPEEFDELYIQLPFKDMETNSNDEQNGADEEHAFIDDMNEPDGALNRQDIDYVAKRLQNGVFVGRQMAIVILRAFGNCCGSQAVEEIWTQLEPMWHSGRRKENDISAVKEVLDQELSRSSRNM